MQVFTEGKAGKLVKDCPPAEISFLPVDIDDGRSGKYDAQIPVGIVNVFDLPCPALIFVNFVNEQYFASMKPETLSQIDQAIGCKVNIIHRDIHCALICWVG